MTNWNAVDVARKGLRPTMPILMHSRSISQSAIHLLISGTHDAQRDQVKRYESNGWKSPYQSEADAVDQAHRVADGYNRQFLRVLRQLRDPKRHALVVIQNAQQVNVGNQQLDVSE
jgi:hypothetical protein